MAKKTKEPVDPVVEQIVSQRLRACKHFTGVQNERCAAGVKYESVRVRAGQGTTTLPCLKPTRQDEARGVVDCDTCPRREWRDEAAVRAGAKREEEEVRFSLEVAALVQAHVGTRRCVQGCIACPKCGKKTLAYSVASNGHIAAKCSNGCVSFMQ